MGATMEAECIVCGLAVPPHGLRRTDLGEIMAFDCSNCGVAFTEASDHEGRLFEGAYIGKAKFSNSMDFYARMNLYGRGLSPQSARRFLSFGHRLALAWFDNNLPRGATVLDVGCGMGLFLTLLADHGFSPVGYDIAPQPIQVLRDRGVAAFDGPTLVYPSDFATPQAVTICQVLHHIARPVEFLARIRTQIPNAPLLVIQDRRDNWVHRLLRQPVFADPPRGMACYSARAVSTALQRAGYRDVQIMSAGPHGVDLPYGPLHRRARDAYLQYITWAERSRKGRGLTQLEHQLFLRGAEALLVVKGFLSFPLVLYARTRRWPGCNVVVIGFP